MAQGRASSAAHLVAEGPTAAVGRLSNLWQLPLLLISLGLFGYAAYLFIDPQWGPSVEQRIATAHTLLNQERPQAAIDLCNAVIDSEKLTIPQQGQIHLILAESLDMGQKQQRTRIPANDIAIVEQTHQAIEAGVQPDAPIARRLGECYENLDHPVEALNYYKQAMVLDKDHGLHLQRKIIELELVQEDPTPADDSLKDYLTLTTLSPGERSWALGERAQLLIDAGKYAEARLLLDEALKLATDPASLAAVNYRQGYCDYKLGDTANAERFLRAARDQLTIRNPLDADACQLLGKILQDRGDEKGALSFFQTVLISHIDSPLVPLARLGRGTCRISLGEDDAGLTDLHDVVNEIQARESRLKYKKDAITGLRRAATILSGRQNPAGALEAMADEQTLDPDPSANFYARLGTVYEQRANQVEQLIATGPAADRIRHASQVRELRTHAGDAYVAYSRKLTVVDDAGYADAMWKGVDLYDRAGDLPRVISALELFVAERPDDRLTPDALLHLGESYQASGQFDKAIEAYQQNQFRYPNSLAASKSAVPLAKAYIAKGPAAYEKAERALRSVLENNPLITPEAQEFRDALYQLSQLYYRTDRYEDAVARLEEFTKRYPTDDRVSELVFLMADSYRKSALALDRKPGPAAADAVGNPPAPDLTEIAAAKRDRLTKARGLYDRVIDQFRSHEPTTDTDKLYLKLAHFYRADCLYDLGDFSGAIKLYDAAAFRYQDDPASLAAYVQIVNAYCALGKIDEAKTANERAKWILRRIPADAFKDGAFPMPKDYWAAWLQWTSNAGMW